MSALDEILERLHSYDRSHRLDADIEEVAHAEAFEDDPLIARRISPEDLYGVGAAFGHRLETTIVLKIGP